MQNSLVMSPSPVQLETGSKHAKNKDQRASKRLAAATEGHRLLQDVMDEAVYS